MLGESRGEASLADLRIGGTEIHCVLCPRKLGWFSHGMGQEHVQGTGGAESVAPGGCRVRASYPCSLAGKSA
jgi:hypothetical protein